MASTCRNNDSSKSPYYRKVDQQTLDTAKTEIVGVLQEALSDGIISRADLEAMDPRDKGPSQFYQLFKVHKEHEPGRAPPIVEHKPSIF